MDWAAAHYNQIVNFIDSYYMLRDEGSCILLVCLAARELSNNIASVNTFVFAILYFL